jgi:hypothetical protein
MGKWLSAKGFVESETEKKYILKFTPVVFTKFSREPLRLDVSSSTRITTYQICKYSLYKTLLMMDR